MHGQHGGEGEGSERVAVAVLEEADVFSRILMREKTSTKNSLPASHSASFRAEQELVAGR